jgi:vacuolar-type H+-ATPase subunit I/STV1
MATEPTDHEGTEVSIARLEVQVESMNAKIDSVIQLLRDEQERSKTAIGDHESRIREIEKAGDIRSALESHDKRLDSAERWIHSVPVGLVITLIVAIGGLVSYVGGLPTV